MKETAKNFFLNNQMSEKVLVYFYGIVTIFFTAIFLLRFNSEFAGAKYDSQFYLKMYEYIRIHKSAIPLENYEVASSPIFVHAFGFILLLFGSHYSIAILFSYIIMSLVSLIFFEKLIRQTQLRVKIILITIFCGSGYFVAPMLNPTSDFPMILFLTITLYAFSTSNRSLLSITLFCLLSVRQSLGWILIVFVIWDLYNLLKYRRVTLRDILWTYSFSFISLIATFIYFKNHLFPDLYLELQPKNVYSIPNFFSVIQIGLSSLIMFSPLLFLRYKNIKLTKNSTLLFGYLVLISMASFLFPQNKQIGDGLGYLSFFHGRLNFQIEHLAIFSSLGFLILLKLAQDMNPIEKNFLLLYLFAFLTSSLVIPIPFLRYFQVPLIFAAALIFKTSLDGFKSTHNLIPYIGLIFSIAGNFGAIAS
jgi:hypothetical protein